MKMLEAGYYPAYIARVLGKPRNAIHYYVKWLESLKFIERLQNFESDPHKKNRGVITLYRVTQIGSSFLDGIERVAFGRRV